MTVQELKQTHQKSAPISSSDFGGARTELKLRATFHPAGFPLEFATNSEDVLEAARVTWAGSKALFKAWPIQLRLAVTESLTHVQPAPPKLRIEHNIVSYVADQENYYVCDIAQGFGVAYLSQKAAEDTHFLRTYFLESAAKCLIGNRHATPIRAACVDLDGRGVLLCGDPSAGKSTLAYACAKTGWAVVADDCSFLLNDRTIAGSPLSMWLGADASELFPELAGCETIQGSPPADKLELRMCSNPAVKTLQTTQISYVVFLNRFGPKHQQLDVFPKEVARHYMTKPLFSLPEIRAVQETRIASLLQVKTLELRYHELAYGVSRLTRLVREDR